MIILKVYYLFPLQSFGLAYKTFVHSKLVDLIHKRDFLKHNHSKLIVQYSRTLPGEFLLDHLTQNISVLRTIM